MKCAIIGYGHVGKAMADLFREAILYDEPLNLGSREAVNKCDAAFVCVPTTMKEDGSCDTSIVENVLEWIAVRVVILRSTVPVGFTKKW